jgi:hypothetical protein
VQNLCCDIGMIGGHLPPALCAAFCRHADKADERGGEGFDGVQFDVSLLSVRASCWIRSDAFSPTMIALSSQKTQEIAAR